METEFIEISEDKQLKKKILVAGNGLSPLNGQEVQVLYRGTLLSGEEFDSNQNRDEPFKFVLGQGSVIKGWDQGVITMTKGQKSILLCPPEYAYGKRGSPPKIPADATLQFQVQLLDFHDKKKQKWEMSDQQKINEALTAKNQGNKLFKEGKFAAAIKEYKSGLQFTDDLETPQGTNLKKTFWLNICTSALKNNEFRLAVQHANKVLDKQPQNLKALYRKGSALLSLQQFQTSRECLQKALKVQPSSAQVKSELDLLEKKAKKYAAKQKKMLSGMLLGGYIDQEEERKKIQKRKQIELKEKQEYEKATGCKRSQTDKDQGKCPFMQKKQPKDECKDECKDDCKKSCQKEECKEQKCKQDCC